MSSPSHNKNNHFLPADKISRLFKRKINPEQCKLMQQFIEKITSDIITRSALLAKHADSDVIDATEVCAVIDKNFDATFGIKTAIPETRQPIDSHTEKMAEISKQK